MINVSNIKVPTSTKQEENEREKRKLNTDIDSKGNNEAIMYDVENSKKIKKSINNSEEIMKMSIPPPMSNNNQIGIQIFIDEINQVYFSRFSQHANKIQQAKMLASLFGKQDLHGHDASIGDVWVGVIKYSEFTIKERISVLRKIPGIKEISDTQILKILVNNHLIDFMVIIFKLIHIGTKNIISNFLQIFNLLFCHRGESYMPLPNKIILTSKWIETLIGKKTKDGLFDFIKKFNQLDLKDSEKAVLLP